ncbi:MAG TPA: ADP-heptose--LPS heptosyltransferase, partial [Casimicrobiaceae bacterium]|nr:ADP-heptose--LPS heptosyltransferase [Casimicrobiaceae bacterium]
GSDFGDVGIAWEAGMRAGDFEAAWRATDRIERVRRTDEAAGRLAHRPDHLLWNGTSFAGRRVLVRCNHGLGDTLQFIRYVPLLRAIARQVSVLVQPHLLELLRSPELGDVQNGWTDAPPPLHDVAIEIMELPYAFRSTIDTLPRRVPYLPLAHLRRFAADPPRLAEGAFRVGLVWGSSDWDPSRSVPLQALAPLAGVPDVRFYGLQQGEHAQSPAEAPFSMTVLSPHTSAIAAAAAAMMELDLVITVDCMAAHLAGALGRPVWVMLKADADWRWMERRDDSPWYPTMRLFRQPREGDWAAMVDRIAGALAAVVKPSATGGRAVWLS